MAASRRGLIGPSASKWKTGPGRMQDIEAAQTHLPPMEEWAA